MQHEVNVLALYKGTERFIYVYDDVSRDDLISTIRDQAADPHLTVNWFDAAILTDRIRQQVPNSSSEPAKKFPSRL